MKKFSYILFDNYNTLTDFNLYIQKSEISESGNKNRNFRYSSEQMES